MCLETESYVRDGPSVVAAAPEGDTFHSSSASYVADGEMIYFGMFRVVPHHFMKYTTGTGALAAALPRAGSSSLAFDTCSILVTYNSSRLCGVVCALMVPLVPPLNPLLFASFFWRVSLSAARAHQMKMRRLGSFINYSTRRSLSRGLVCECTARWRPNSFSAHSFMRTDGLSRCFWQAAPAAGWSARCSGAFQ